MSENIFYTKFSEISSSRFDPFFYIPELVELENKVKKVSTKKLKDFVISVSSGATPKKSIANEYYAENEKDGIPFLRVQNLTKYGKLDFDGLKFITKDTHEKMLKRSQVEEDDLLVKITGVGRMAIASVPEKGFVGNTNQHMVVIKTKDRKTSETLATYLNLDIAEKLASRRATGGTRPALDYPALLSIPIIYNENIVAKLQEAYKQKQQKEKEAKEKLDSIDKYLLQELGVELLSNEQEKLEDRVFLRRLSELSEKRFDPECFRKNITEAKIEIIKNFGMNYLGDFIDDIYRYPTFFGIEYKENGIPVIKGENISELGEIKFNEKTDYIDEKTHDIFFRTQLKKNDLIFTVRGSIGKVGIFNLNERANISANVIKITLKENTDPEFIMYYLNSTIGQLFIKSLESGQVQKTITVQDIKNIIVPLLDIDVQIKISSNIKQLILDSLRLNNEAIDIYVDAKKEVEKMILGERNA